MVKPKLTAIQRRKASWFRPYFENKNRNRNYWNSTRISNLGDSLIEWFKDNQKAITLGAFCADVKIPSGYIAQFSRKNDYFKYCVQVTKDLLETRILDMGLAGEIDRVLAIFSLKNIAGWADKREVSNTLEITSKIIELQLPKKDKIIEVEGHVVDEGPVPGRKQVNS